MSEIDYDLSILNSNVCYRKLDNVQDVFIDDDEDFWNRYIKNACINKTSIFRSLLNAFHYVAYFKREEDIIFKERWNYLYFWVGSKALKNISENCSFGTFISILKSVKTRMHEVPYEYDIEKISSRDFQDLKTVFDYVINYDSIKLKIGGHTSDCTQLYKQYVDSSYEVYKNLESRCQNNVNEEYCKFFNYIVKKQKDTILKPLTCNGTMKPLSVEQYKESISRDVLLDSEPKEQIQGAKSSGTDNMMPTFFPILGIFSILFTLYNITPFRSWLHNILAQNQTIQHGIYEEEIHEFFENEYEPLDSNSEINRNHITYHSIINS
ncbi:PIR Superfamily Protein [Plasmodium ovale wallikeri]|uniref:PIR protein n=2 Tax=Plasmodium ovale TaxID=36330 RepID=A0A1C3KHK1_PLAOA|nr:PIR Superfamily Protein [Plasmodium ovale wallikeri]SBT73207.1 PIR protein [Plasmodium ovale]